MKIQPTHSVEGNLIRGAFCLLLLLAVCMVPFAQAQRKAPKQSMAKLGDTLPFNIIVVTNTNDSGPGSLRQALVDANDGDTIDATGVSGTILLTSGQLVVDKDVTMSGSGANHLAVNGNAQSRVFYINLGKTVTISGLTITNGNVTNESGGGIYNDGGTLAVSDCTVNGNSASYGGGIINDSTNGSATTTITNSTFSGNSGRGIANISTNGTNGSATTTITNSTFSGNLGGGIANSGAFGGSATLTVTDSTLSSNSAPASDGGGIANGASRGSATLTVTNCTLRGNSAANSGGGIVNGASSGGATMTITNSTLSGNSAGSGGGISSLSGKAADPR